MVHSDLSKHLSLAVDAAEDASKYLLKNLKSSQKVDLQKGHDLKLRADRIAEGRIVKLLGKHTDFAILAEEGGLRKGKNKDWSWVIDPLDGTINYFHQIPCCCVSIALCYQDAPQLGVVYDFNRQEVFTGIVGLGAWLNSKPMRVSCTRQKNKAVLATGFPSQNRLMKRDISIFERHLKAYQKLRLFGSAALSLAYVACSRVDAYYEKDIMYWDVAAGLALVLAAGGTFEEQKVRGMYGREIFAHNGILNN